MPDVKISDATPVDVLRPDDLMPIARVGVDIPLNARLSDVAQYVTVLASEHPPAMSDLPESAGVLVQYARADHIHPTDTSRAPIASPAFTGTPTAPTVPSDDSSDALATTSFVHTLARSGTLRTQTPGIDDNSELVATTEYVQNQSWAEPPLMNGPPTAGVSRRFARGDHVHATDTSRAAASAVPAASTAAPVMDGTATAGTAATFARGDHVHPSDTSRYAANNPSGFQTAAQVASAMAGYAPVASPVFTGDPRAPTPAPADADTSIATTAFVRTGTTAGDDAAAGQVGEYQAGQTLSTAALPLTNNVDLVIFAFTLSPGDWDVWGSVGFTLNNNNATTLRGWINAAGATAPSVDQMGGNAAMLPIANNSTMVIMPVTPLRVSSAAQITVRLGATGTFTGTITAWGKLIARRRR